MIAVARPAPDPHVKAPTGSFWSWLMLVATLFVIASQGAFAYPLTQAQRDRLTKYVPKALEKLERRQPVHVVVIGEGVSRMMTRDERSQDVLSSMYGHFLEGFEAEFYYTGGVRLINPIGKNPAKTRTHKGEEITFEQFTEPDGSVLSALRQLSGRALLNHPDIVMIQAGVNDCLNGLLLTTFTDTLTAAVAKAEESGSEVIVVDPTLIHEIGVIGSWGQTRSYAAAARRVAEQAGAMFLDPAMELAHTRPIPDDGDAGERAGQISEAIALELFDYGPGVKETVLINAESHRRAGRGMFQQFLNGVPASEWRVSGSGLLVRPRELEVSLSVTNSSDRVKRGVVIPLDIGTAWRSSVPALDVACQPGEKKKFKILYKQRVISGEGDSAVYAGSQLGLDGSLHCPILVSDLYDTNLIDVTGALGPLKLAWDFTPQQGRRGPFPIKFTLENPSEEKLTGTYELSYANQRARGVTFELGPKQTKEFSNQCALPKDEKCWAAKHPLSLAVETGSTKFIEEREVEVIRNQRLGEKRPLARADGLTAASGPIEADGKTSFSVTADADLIKLKFDLGNVEIQAIPGKPSMLLELSLDGRPSEESGAPGFVYPLQIGFSQDDGPGKVASIGDAAFGDGYSKELSPLGVFATISTKEGGGRELSVSIPKLYLYRHDWTLADPDGRIGVLARVNFARRDSSGMGGYPAEARWMNAAAPFCRDDASALPQLELAPGDSSAWSVHLY